jgi:hypothetical protein
MLESLKKGAAGAGGGLVGTVLVQQGVKLSARLPERLRPPAMTADPGEFMVRKAEAALGKNLSPRARGALSHGLHWAYGTFWPSVTGLVLGRLVGASLPRALGVGTALGAGVWAIGYLGWLPATELVGKESRREPARQGATLVSHLLYGLASVLPVYLHARLRGERRQRGRLARLLRR